MDDTVTIEHDEHGRVEGIKKKNVYTTIWMKNGAHYFGSDGWREVPKPKWVPVHVDIICLSRVFGNGICLDLPPGHRWKTVEVEREVEG